MDLLTKLEKKFDSVAKVMVPRLFPYTDSQEALTQIVVELFSAYTLDRLQLFTRNVQGDVVLLPKEIADELVSTWAETWIRSAQRK